MLVGTFFSILGILPYYWSLFFSQLRDMSTYLHTGGCPIVVSKQTILGTSELELPTFFLCTLCNELITLL